MRHANGPATVGQFRVTGEGGQTPLVSLDPAVDAPGFEPPSGALTWRGGGKRLFDLLASLALAPVVLPIIAAASAAILITMGRPVFFRQVRLGLAGRPFMILKLRTMRAGETRAQLATAMGDQRVTPTGRWLRRFHIDELPQLWNVLVGDMSLVGPRPEQPTLAEAYARAVPAFALRTLMRPGITGLAQVSAGYAADLAETRLKLAHDLHYVKHCSFGLDAEICVRTVRALLSGVGTR
jgi:lipopolysaccharide/colanic/teichoic acid biosynthesis glycosyltransferase